jgi:hypothetical protein
LSTSEGRRDARRTLVDPIVLTPMDELLAAELFGDLATIMRFSETRKHTTK